MRMNKNWEIEVIGEDVTDCNGKRIAELNLHRTSAIAMNEIVERVNDYERLQEELGYVRGELIEIMADVVDQPETRMKVVSLILTLEDILSKK
jgi:hypothetical protein